MNTNQLFDGDIVYKITGCAMAVLNELGHGLREKTYENALALELAHQGLKYSTQEKYQVYYRDQHIDDYIPDLVVENKVIVELKTAESICNEHLGQTLNYLRISKLETGLILNFKHSKLEWKKVILN